MPNFHYCDCLKYILLKHIRCDMTANNKIQVFIKI